MPPRPTDQNVVVDALAAGYGGTAVAAARIARGLAGATGVGDVIVAAGRGSAVAYALAGERDLRLLTPVGSGQAELARRLAWEATGLRRLTARHAPAVVFSLSGILPRHPGAPVVSYLGNSLMLVSNKRADRLRCAALRRSNRDAVVLVPTRAMRALLASTLSLRSEVVPLGVDHELFSPDSRRGSEILVVANFYPHKRHELAIAAWSRLREPRPVLRLVGDRRVDPHYAQAVERMAADHAPCGRIEMQDPVESTKMPQLYRAAAVLLQPSERESFCMPVLEAAACGVPVLARDSDVLHETAGDGSTFVAGDDPDRWADALQALLDDQSARERAHDRGLEHAAGYSWDRTVAAIRDHVVQASRQAL